MPDSLSSQNANQQNSPLPQTGANLDSRQRVAGSSGQKDTVQDSSLQAIPPVTPLAQADNSQNLVSSQQSQGSQVPKEQSVEEIENELLVGAGPGQKNAGVVAGQGPPEDQKPVASVSMPQKSVSSTDDDQKKNEENPDDEAATKKKADEANLPYVNLTGFAISTETLNLIPEDIARKYKVIPYLRANKNVRVASSDPKNKEMIKVVSDILGSLELEPLFSYCSQKSFQYALKNYQFVKKPTEAGDDVKVSGQRTSFKTEIQGFIALKNEIGKVPTTKLFDVIISGGVKTEASDIHIEPTKNTMKIRYRIDGVLQDIAELPKEAYESMLSRVKFLAKMKLDLKNLPQDGRFTINSEGKSIDLRVSTLPTVYGESLVMRLLQQDKGFITLEKLGFNPISQKMVEEAISRPTGMILNTGPTGSGKTTTLYAILEKLNKPGVKIITLEDPVEYRVPGVIQSQVDSYAKYSFAKGLRSILRQDPDIVMVGEIRDLETARIALNAAMTGHLVLSTLHTNNATSAPSRLLEIGVKPFLVAGNINLIIAQRLVRKLCDQCKEKYKPRPGIIEAIRKSAPKLQVPEYLYKTGKCKECQGTGFAGRIPIVETFKPTPEIEKMVLESTPSAKIRDKVIAEGMITMEQDGIEKVVKGITTIQEVWRVTREK